MKRTRSRTSKHTKVSIDESTKVVNKKNKHTIGKNEVADDKNQVTDKKNKVTDKSNEVINKRKKICDETTINQLNDDCLMNVFKFLPVVDRIRIQRVCKRWQNISKMPWSDKKSLVLFDETWSSNLREYHSFQRLNIDDIDIDDIIETNRPRKKNRLSEIKPVLKLCGPFVTHIRFNKYNVSTDVYKEIIKRCPNLNSLDHSGSVITHNARLKYLANNFHSLRHFKLGYCNTYPIDGFFAIFFKNNVNLRTLRLRNANVSGYCLQFLSETLEEFDFYQRDSQIYPDIIYYSLGRLPNLQTLSLDFYYKGIKVDIHRALKALPSNSSIKKLILKNDLNQMIPLESKYWARLKNLECLRLRGVWSFSMGIDDYCPKLSQILLDGLSMSDLALESILAMPNLRKLIFLNIEDLEDGHFLEETYVEELGIHYCDNISTEGFIWLSRNARNLKKIQISVDEKSDESIEINALQKIFKKKNVKILINEKFPY